MLRRDFLKLLATTPLARLVTADDPPLLTAEPHWLSANGTRIAPFEGVGRVHVPLPPRAAVSGVWLFHEPVSGSSPLDLRILRPGARWPILHMRCHHMTSIVGWSAAPNEEVSTTDGISVVWLGDRRFRFAGSIAYSLPS